MKFQVHIHPEANEMERTRMHKFQELMTARGHEFGDSGDFVCSTCDLPQYGNAVNMCPTKVSRSLYSVFETYDIYNGFVEKTETHPLTLVNLAIIPNPCDRSEFSYEKGDYFLTFGFPEETKLGVPYRPELLAKAKALIVGESIGVDIFVESLMAGTPIIAGRWGHIQDFVINGVTGFLCQTEEDIHEAMDKIDTIDPRRCREWALSRFSPDYVAGEYERYFQRIVKAGTPKMNRMNLPFIKFENFLNQAEYDECYDILKAKEGWDNSGTSLGTPGKNFGNKPLNDYPIFSTKIMKKICERTGDAFLLKRVYANSQKVGQDGEFHQDDMEPGCFTFLMYFNTIPDGGETEFQVSDGTLMSQKAILNLGVLFKADILHRGLAPKTGNEARITVAWKLQALSKFMFFESPVPHCIVRNYYNEKELELIFDELKFLKGKLMPPEQTGTAVGEDGKPKKRNKGAFIDDLYTKRELSNILQLNKKIASPEIWANLDGKHWFYKYIKPSDRLTAKTLLSYYEDGDYYKPHTDSAMVTAISYHWTEPKQFKGGELYFGDYLVPIENNSLLIFPSCTEHEVKPVIGEGRYALTQFLNYQ
jgi:hypothetical protein